MLSGKKMLEVTKRSFSAQTCHPDFFVTDLKHFCTHPPFGSKFIDRTSPEDEFGFHDKIKTMKRYGGVITVKNVDGGLL